MAYDLSLTKRTTRMMVQPKREKNRLTSTKKIWKTYPACNVHLGVCMCICVYDHTTETHRLAKWVQYAASSFYWTRLMLTVLWNVKIPNKCTHCLIFTKKFRFSDENSSKRKWELWSNNLSMQVRKFGAMFLYGSLWVTGFHTKEFQSDWHPTFMCSQNKPLCWHQKWIYWKEQTLPFGTVLIVLHLVVRPMKRTIHRINIAWI